MKNKIFSAIILAFVLVSCNQKNKETAPETDKMQDSTTMMQTDTMTMDHSKMNHTEKMYACPMHPEVQGKMDEKCSKCGMNLTEPVTKTPEKK